MPAVSVENPLVLPRVARPDAARTVARPVARLIQAQRQLEGANLEIWRPFPGPVAMVDVDPFLLLDQLGPRLNGPGDAGGAPWHPHRGFETVSYVMDGEISHHDTNGGGGIIREGDTQWMTAGSGILHDELPTERAYRLGGPAHMVQLWVNLPSTLKFSPPRYQSITRDDLVLLSSPDGGALVRLIAGDLAGHSGPGVTHTPITYAHATIAAGAELSLPWNPSYSAMAYVLTGQGSAGPRERPIADHQLVIFGRGDNVVLRAADHITGDWTSLDVLILGGMGIGEPIAHYGPFVMNTRDELTQAFTDYQAGRLGIIPADQMAPRKYS
jgi:redox-sensitive bicupin YhaK (pirin superfamily)